MLNFVYFLHPRNLFCDSIALWGLISWEKTEGWRSCGGSRWEYFHWDLIIPRGSEQPWCWLAPCQLSSGSSALLPKPSGSTSLHLWIKVMMKGKVQYNNRQGCSWWWSLKGERGGVGAWRDFAGLHPAKLGELAEVLNKWQYNVCVYNITSGLPLWLCLSGAGQWELQWFLVSLSFLWVQEP